MTDKEIKQLLLNAVGELYLACLGLDGEKRISLKEKMDNPRPGDLVYETTTRRQEGIGYLIQKKSEFVEYTESEGGYYDDFTYIEDLNGQLQRWRNCEFRRILTTDGFSLMRSDPLPSKDFVDSLINKHGL